MQVLEALNSLVWRERVLSFENLKFTLVAFIETAINASFAKKFRGSFTFGPMLLISGVVKLRCHF